MRLSWLLVFVLFIPKLALAFTEITTQIHEVDIGTQPGDDVLVLLKTGDVARLNVSELDKIEELQSYAFYGGWFTFSLDEKRFIKRIFSAAAPVATIEEKQSFYDFNYTPTTVASMEVAEGYIKEARSRVEREGTTQCFNRAMVWSYDWWKKHSLRSMKMFIFWPKEYIRKYSFKWWFHVTPYVHVMDTDGIVKERALDVKWISRPYSMQDWADFHSTKDVKCRVVEKYSDYANNPFYSDRCYFMRANMYTWQPADLEMNEAWGYSKDAFNMDEVRAAFLEAFNINF